MAMDEQQTKVVAAYVVTEVNAQREVVVLENGRVFGRWVGVREWEEDPPIPV
jgi:hypothetical protein